MTHKIELNAPGEIDGPFALQPPQVLHGTKEVIITVDKSNRQRGNKEKG